MASYLDVAGFKGLTIAPAVYVDQVDAIEAGWTLKQLTHWSSWLDARLKKRYAAPFNPASPPATVQGWLARIVTEELYLKRGIDATDEQWTRVQERAKEAKDEVKEAAESKDGLFELPLREDDPTVTGVTRGSPLVYTEAGPYHAFTLQRDAAEDQ